MATPTAACPECGGATSPGRYTCPECGAFLDGVAVAPRAWAPVSAAVAEQVSVTAPLESAVAAGTAQPIDDANDPLLADGPALDPAPPTWPPQPDVLHDVEWPSFDEARSVLSSGSAAPAAGDLEDTEPESPTDVPTAPDRSRVDGPPPESSAIPGLPPLPAPEPRVPAGAWLPPSALLTGLDETNAGAAAAAAIPLGAAGSPARTSPRDWFAPFGAVERRWATARRAIALGAAVTVIGFVLPWANGSVANLLNVWTSVWGLAGAGHWLIVAAVAALGLLASTSGRLATVPLGIPAIAVAALVLGLIWPTLLGAASRPIGTLVVLVGVLVIGVGGALGSSARHEAATPDV